MRATRLLRQNSKIKAKKEEKKRSDTGQKNMGTELPGYRWSLQVWLHHEHIQKQGDQISTPGSG